jgi:heme exporter protein D
MLVYMWLFVCVTNADLYTLVTQKVTQTKPTYI